MTFAVGDKVRIKFGAATERSLLENDLDRQHFPAGQEGTIVSVSAYDTDEYPYHVDVESATIFFFDDEELELAE